jgi:hypothetical protein
MILLLLVETLVDEPSPFWKTKQFWQRYRTSYVVAFTNEEIWVMVALPV